MAEELEINPSYLSQCFKSWEGISMKQFILREKIRLCKNMLTYSPYSCSAIAAYLGFSSQSHLGKLFKKETGNTFSAYLNRVRIEHSKELLRHPNIRLTDIALMVGFEDQSYFTKVFKKLTGTTPLHYRESKGGHKK